VRVYPGDYGISVFFTVITERKHAEQALRLANDVLSNMQLGMYVYHLEDIDDDRTLRLISANPAAEVMTGVKASDIIGNTLDENFPYLRKMGFPQRYAEVVRNGTARIFEDIVYSDNRIMRTFFSVKAFPLPDNHLGVAFENITEKVQAQNKIAESNSRLKLAQEIGNVGSWELDIITNKVTWSDHTFKIYEENPDSFEVNFENIVSHYPKGDKENIIEALNRAIIEKKDLYIEHVVFTGKGNTRYVLESGRMILSEDGEPLKLVGSVADITVLKIAENELRKSKDLFQQISLMTKAGGWYVDLITGEHNWTDLKREIHEVGPDFIPNMENAINFYEEGENREKITKLINLCIEKGEPFDTEAQLITAKGNRRSIRTMGSAEFQDGKCVRLTGTFQDITQRKHAEQALKISNEKYKTMLDASPDGILIIDKKGIITEVSEIGIELLGADNRNDLIGKHFIRFIPTEEKNTIHTAIEKTNNEGIAQNIEIKIKKKNQSVFLSEISLTLIQDSYGIPFSFMTTIRDISQRKKMEKKIIHADRMASLGEMASGIAHEINQPLSTISFVMDNILCEASKDENLEKSYVEKKSKKIFENIIRIRNIIDHIRDFSRSRDDYILTGFDINSSISNAVSMLNEQFKHQSISLNLTLEENLPLIIGNTFNFEQVVLNLLSNAKDALLEKKSKQPADYDMFIEIKSFRENQNLVIEFIDNGAGISDEDIDNVMLPFYTTKDTGKGTGLGLSISYHIIKEMNGSIELTGNLFGGVTFRIILLIQNKN
jgi:PAS domain S-box-containing protein